MVTRASNVARSYSLGIMGQYPVIASDIVYEGSLVGLDTAGNARPLVSGDLAVGFAREKVDNTSGAAGDLTVKVQKKGIIELAVSGAVATDVGKAVMATDDDTFVLESNDGSFVGHISRFVSAGVVEVAFDFERAEIGATITVAAQSGNDIALAIQLSAEGAVRAYFASDANGDAVNAASADFSVVIGADGQLFELVADSYYELISENDGDIDLTVSHAATGPDTLYLIVILPNGRKIASDAISFT